jgi:hypothetical protein
VNEVDVMERSALNPSASLRMKGGKRGEGVGGMGRMGRYGWGCSRHEAGRYGARGAAAERRRLTTAWRGWPRWTGGRMESLRDGCSIDPSATLRMTVVCAQDDGCCARDENGCVVDEGRRVERWVSVRGRSLA